MIITSYETKEQTASGFRAIVVTPFEQGSGRVDFVTADDQRHVIDLEDLAFLVRAAASLPRHVLEPDVNTQPIAVQPAPLAQEEKPAPVKRPAQAGKPWTSDQEAQLRGLYGSGSGIKEIAKNMGRSPTAILSRLLEMNWVVVLPNQEVIESSRE